MLDQCQANLERWRQIDEETKGQDEQSCGVDALTFLDKVLETTEKSPEKPPPEVESNVVPEVHENNVNNTSNNTQKSEEEGPGADSEEVENRKGESEDSLANENETETEEKSVSSNRCGIKGDEVEKSGSENKDDDVDVSLIIQQLTDEDPEVEIHGTIRVADAKVMKHKTNTLET